MATIESLEEQVKNLNATLAKQEKARQLGLYIAVGVLLIRLFWGGGKGKKKGK